MKRCPRLENGWLQDKFLRVVALQTYDDVEKTLGLQWSLVDDELFVKLTLDESDSKFFEGQAFPVAVKPKLPLKLCLHFHMKVFDPLGLVMPTKIIVSSCSSNC